MTAVQMTCGSQPEESSTMVLESERLVLRAPRLEDAKAIAGLANNRKIAEMTALVPHPYGIEDAETWITSVSEADKGAIFAVFSKQEKLAFVGACGYGSRGGVGEWREGSAPELGYWIGEPYWSRGYATEAVRAVIDHAFAEAGEEQLLASCRVTNLASRRVLEKCGFQWIGAGLCRVRALGASVPSDRFRLDRRTWASLRAWGRTGLPGRATAAAGRAKR